MPPEPSVTSACEGPRSCTLRYSSALLPKSFERPGPKSVSPATYCSGVKVVVWWRWIVDMNYPPVRNKLLEGYSSSFGAVKKLAAPQDSGPTRARCDALL